MPSMRPASGRRPTSPPATRTSCRAASASGSSSPARWSSSRRSSWRTSPCRCSTCRSGPSSSGSCSTCGRRAGLTYLFITHDLSLAWVIADRIAVMYLGKIMEIGPAERVIRSPQNPYTRALVSVSPTPEPPTPGERARRTILVGETPGRRAHPDRLPLQPSLSERVRPLPGRGTTAHRRGRGPDERVLAGRGRTAAPGARHGPGRAQPDGCRASRGRGSGPGLTRPATRGSRAPRPGWPGRLARAAHPATRGTAPRRAPAGPRRYRVPRRRPPRRAVRG